MKTTKQMGFTLIELMIAITILAIIASMAYSGLNSVLKSHEILTTQQNSFNQLNQIMTQLQREIQAIVPRPVHDKYNEMIPALKLETANTISFSFTRSGIANPLELPKSSLQRIDYFFNGKTLKKQTWLTIDRNNSADYREEIISSDLKTFKIEVMGFNGMWYQQWPLNKKDSLDILPKAIRFSFSTPIAENMTRIVELPL